MYENLLTNTNSDKNYKKWVLPFFGVHLVKDDRTMKRIEDDQSISHEFQPWTK